MQAIIPCAPETCYNHRTASTCEHISLREEPISVSSGLSRVYANTDDSTGDARPCTAGTNREAGNAFVAPGKGEIWYVLATPILTDKDCLQRRILPKVPGLLPTSEKRFLAERVLAA